MNMGLESGTIFYYRSSYYNGKASGTNYNSSKKLVSLQRGVK